MKITKILKKDGFTLVELLVAVSVLGVLGVVITSVLVQSLKGEKKVQVLNQTKQNAQLILDRIIKDVQGASYIYCVGDSDDLSNSHNDLTQDTLVIVDTDSTGKNTYNRYRFFNEINNSTTATNGYIAFDTANTPLGCSSTDLYPSSPLILTNQSKTDGISLTYYSLDPGDTFSKEVFYDNVQPGSPDSVTVKFRANAGVSAQTLFDTSEQQSGNAGVGFGSTATVRNGSI